MICKGCGSDTDPAKMLPVRGQEMCPECAGYWRKLFSRASNERPCNCGNCDFCDQRGEAIAEARADGRRP